MIANSVPFYTSKNKIGSKPETSQITPKTSEIKNSLSFGSKANQDLLEEARYIISGYTASKRKLSLDIKKTLFAISELFFKNATRKSQEADKKALKYAGLKARAIAKRKS